ncbi:MAG: glycoside hydrolase family 9 protein [Fibrobacter sp.]|nr:glycoside hydrolase family 9 protein [Fibrobacter sp.]
MTYLKKLLTASFVLGELLCVNAMAQLPAIDRTDKVHERRYLDSLNVFNRRPIRVNQAGFRPQDNKYAYVANPTSMTFKVIDANTLREVDAGNTTLTSVGTAPKPGIWVNGAFNSITSVYEFGSKAETSSTEQLYKADFTGLTAIGEYFIVNGNDTSATFHVHPSIYNAVFENSLKFFGIQRCGNTKSHFHAPCHLKDGSAVHHDLTGGWHDCGDHFKVSETLGYTAYALAMTYLVYQEKAEDRYGNSYDDTVFTDGIPDLLYEAKVGADYIYKLYKASKEDGLIAQHDMYHSIGVGSADHQFWDVPEKQDAQTQDKGGPDRPVAKGIGTGAGVYAAALAYFAMGWYVYDPVYADSLIDAAKDIYKNVLRSYVYGLGGSYTTTDGLLGFYPGGTSETNMIDDAAAAALALWYATKDTTYQYDLYKNLKINDNSTNYGYNNEPDDAGPYFKGGFLGLKSGFTPGGWPTDFENIHSYVLFSFVKLILKDKETAQEYNVGELERDTLIQRATNCLRRLTDDGSQGSNLVYENRFGKVTSDGPYNLVWTSSDWGFNRYNMGAANAIFMLSEITQGAEKEAYKNLALDNIYYNLGANPWDISFLMGAGDKNLNHPHNRAANPDGYNAGGMPYEYKCPRGALMGGAAPNAVLLEDWSDYTATETCIDFSVQLLIPAQSLAEPLPIDAEGPLFSNITGTPISNTEAIVSWDANEVALVTVFYSETPDENTTKSVQQTTASKGGSVMLTNLEPGKTYYFFLEGMDTKRNLTTDNNHGQWYQFTMTPANTNISGVTICQVDHRSAKIYWWSSDRMNGIVNYGTSSGNYSDAKAAEGGAVLFHEATLTDLRAGTTYYFTVSSGAKTSEEFSFTTEAYATYANLDIYLKPSSYGSEASCSAWQDCHAFIMSITNNDTIPFEDFEVRLYLNNENLAALGNAHQNFGGDGQMGKPINITFGSSQPDGFGGYYLPINVKGVVEVSGQLIIQVIFHDYNPSVKTVTFKEIENSWSLRPHTAETDPEYFKGIDLTQAPFFKGSETTFVEHNSNGTKVVAFTRDPYIAVFYHGKHIYGYTPDYTPETGPQVSRTVALTFDKPFKTPFYSVEQEVYEAKYSGSSKVSPMGILDDFEMNGNSYFDKTMYFPDTRKDSLLFLHDTTLSYGNNYMEWVSWHNHAANKSGSYDCACAVVRSNVEVDTIMTPPEIRILSFTVDTVRVYTGRMAEVHLQLLDSNRVLLNTDPLTVLLSSESGLAKFYTSATSTIPVDKIDIINGKAVFYVSSDRATTTILKATGTNTSKVNYVPAKAVLIIEDLPPWPIIDVAKMVDTDCDDIPDAFEIKLSNEYIAAENQSFNSIKYVYGNDTITSTKVISQNGRDLVVGANLTGATMNTNPEGSITLVSNTKEGKKESADFYTDGIPPTLVSVSVLEKLPDATSDFVYIQFSEPVKEPSPEWPLRLNSTDVAVHVKGVKLYNEAHNIWEFEIDFDAGGGSLVAEGMKAELAPTATIKDLAGNGIGPCAPKVVDVLLKIRPIPMTYASISDKDEDGLAEHIEIKFAQAVDTKHYPDSISIIFGSAMPETLTVHKSQFQLNADQMSSSFDLPVPFSLGNTNGNYEGTLNGKDLVGAGLVIEHLGDGAAYESESSIAEDLAGPVFTSATLVSSTYEVLTVYISEPVNVIDSLAILYVRERSNLNISKMDINMWSLSNGKTTLNALFDHEATAAVMEGDRINLAPKTASAFADLSGNMPADNNPMVTIGGDTKPKIKFDIHLQTPVTTVSASTPSLNPSNKTINLYIVNPATHKLDRIEGENVVQTGIDTLTTPLNGVVWTMDLTVPRGGALNQPAYWRSLKVKYSIPIYTNMGSFVNRISGNFVVNSDTYYSTNNKVTFFVEWVNAPKGGVRSKQGRAVGTGAYIYKAELDCKFLPNPNLDQETKERFDSSDSYEKTETFGIRRSK